MEDQGKFLGIVKSRTEMTPWPCVHYASMNPVETSARMNNIALKLICGDSV